jgi:hypothetical protein
LLPERQLRFAKLHERRGEVIAATYAALQEMIVALADYTKMFEMAGGPSRAERGKKFVAAANSFITQFRSTKIFLPKATAEMVDKIFHEVRDAHIDFMFGVDGAEKADVQTWRAVYERVEALAKVAIVELEDELRRLLGDKDAWMPGTRPA